MNFFKKNLSLIISLLLPVLFLTSFAVFVKVNNPEILSDYDFVFFECTDVYSDQKVYARNCSSDDLYTIEEVGLIVSDPSLVNGGSLNFYRYDSRSHSKKLLSEYELVNLRVMGKSKISPDGVEVYSGYMSRGGFIFFGGGESGYYFKKDKKSYKLNIEEQFVHNGRFVGWVKNDK